MLMFKEQTSINVRDTLESEDQIGYPMSLFRGCYRFLVDWLRYKRWISSL